MKNNINAAVIGCNMTEEFFETTQRSRVEQFSWKKILVNRQSVVNIDNSFGTPELVDSVDAIVEDTDISLVFVSANSLEFVPKVMQAGKSVRVIS